MTQDLNKGIQDIEYNSLNLPLSMIIDNTGAGGMHKGSIGYMYTASGLKLRTIHRVENPSTRNMTIITAGIPEEEEQVETTVTDYIGNKIYKNGELKKIMIDGGYIDMETGEYNLYVTDHLGNNRAVVSEQGNVIQYTQYYPFGMAFADSEGGEEQPYKYNGKELDTMHGLDMYDYSARYMDPAYGRFTTIDPHAENYYSISPYVYCANNPIKYIDPDGKDYIINFIRDNDGVLTGLNIQAKVYITGVNASSKRAKELNELATDVFESNTIDGITVSFSINYEYAEKISSKDLKAGENILDFNNKKSTSESRSNVKTGRIETTRLAGNTGEIHAGGSNRTVLHETGHFIGLADRYDDVDALNLGGGLKSVDHPGYEKDLMAGGSSLDKSHYKHYINAYGNNKTPKVGIGKYQIGRHKSGRLATPYEEGGLHEKNIFAK